MIITDIIEKKRDKKELTKEEIEFFIDGYTNNKIADYQAAALIMAIYLITLFNQESYLFQIIPEIWVTLADHTRIINL